METPGREISRIKDLWWEYGHPTIVLSGAPDQCSNLISSVAGSLHQAGLYPTQKTQEIFKNAYRVKLNGESYLVLPYHRPADYYAMLTWELKHGAKGFESHPLHTLEMIKHLPQYWTAIISRVNLPEVA